MHDGRKKEKNLIDMTTSIPIHINFDSVLKIVFEKKMVNNVAENAKYYIYIYIYIIYIYIYNVVLCFGFHFGSIIFVIIFIIFITYILPISYG
jgi:hypothetical protein